MVIPHNTIKENEKNEKENDQSILSIMILL